MHTDISRPVSRLYRGLPPRVISGAANTGAIAMADKYSHDELVERVKTPGWRLMTDKKDKTVGGTLQDLLHLSHERKQKGEAPGLIEEIETSVELDMLQIAQLWRYLGLPV
jgi:hypothetical protein